LAKSIRQRLLVNKYDELVFLDDPKSPMKAVPNLMEKKQLIQFLTQKILQISNDEGWVGKEFDSLP